MMRLANKIAGRLLAITCLMSVNPATAQTPSDPELLKNVILPALDLAADPTISKAIKPYSECYAAAVESSPSSKLRDDGEVRDAELTAAGKCKLIKESASADADAALASRSPELSPDARLSMMRLVRRQTNLFALISRYHAQGRYDVFYRYLTRTGRAVKSNRPVATLSGE